MLRENSFLGYPVIYLRTASSGILIPVGLGMRPLKKATKWPWKPLKQWKPRLPVRLRLFLVCMTWAFLLNTPDPAKKKQNTGYEIIQTLY